MRSSTSIPAFLIRRSVFFSLLGFLAIFFITTQAYQTSVEESAEGIADTVAKSTFNAMYLVMSQGWNRDQLDDFMEELEEGNKKSNLGLTIYRGLPVTQLFGPIEQPPIDDQMLKAMTTGTPIMESGDDKLR